MLTPQIEFEGYTTDLPAATNVVPQPEDPPPPPPPPPPPTDCPDGCNGPDWHTFRYINGACVPDTLLYANDPRCRGDSTNKLIVASWDTGVWYTNDLTATSPTFTGLNTGLPAVRTAIYWFARDPVYPNQIGYLATADGLYRNDGLDSAGAWVMKRSTADAGGEVLTVKPQVSAPGRIWIIVDGALNEKRVEHSDNRGETWYTDTALTVWCPLYSGLYSGRTRVFQLSPDHHNINHVHIFGETRTGASTKRCSYWRYDIRDYGKPMQDDVPPGNLLESRWRQAITRVMNKNPCAGHVPYHGNADGNRIYLLNWLEGDSTYEIRRWDVSGFHEDAGRWCGKTADDYVSWEAGTDITPTFMSGNSNNNPALFGSFTYDQDRIYFINSTGECGISTDAGGNWTQKTDVPLNWPQCASGYPYDDALFFVGLQGANNSSPGLLVVSYDAAATWVDKTGDLDAKIRAAFSVAASSPISTRTLAPAWSG